MSPVARLFPLVALVLGFVTPALGQGATDSLPLWRYRGKTPALPTVEVSRLLREPWLRQWESLRLLPPRPRALADVTSTPRHLLADDQKSRADLLRHLGYEAGRGGDATEQRGPLGLSPRTADLTLDGDIRVDISTSRQRTLNCTAAMVASPYSGCSGSFTAPKVENLLNVRSTGVFGQRFHIDVDVNTARSYQSNNVLRAYWQGLEDEVIQRVEAGTVQFRAPPSRYLGASIPVNNKGFSADLQLGPLAIRMISAHQEGSSAVEQIRTIGDVSTQTQDRKVADLDFETGRFFWIVNPTTLPGYPALDILSLDNLIIPDAVRPVDVKVYQYIAANRPGTAGATYDGILATGLNGTEKAGPLRWRALQQNTNYWVDPSGLWMVLASAIDPNDFLAVSYRTKSGEQVGTLPLNDDPARADTVRLIAMPNRGPSSPVFAHGMRQVYRVGGDLVTSSLKVAVELARSEQPASGGGTYLQLFGLAVPTDAATFDVENRLFPRLRDPGANLVIRDQLVVFPNLQPFADSTRLSLSERNDSLYRTPTYLLSTQGPPARFQIRLQYDALSSGDRSGFFIGEIREGSERIVARGRTLVRGVDYRIEYQTGQVTFLNPNELFPPTGGLTISTTFERQSIFAIAPTSIQGLTATWSIGRTGEVSLVSLYQREQSAFRRPPIGSEPKAGFLGGVTSSFNFNLPGVTNLFSSLSRRSVGAPSSLNFAGEIALSRPDPNRYGEAFLEEFEDDGGTTVLLGENNWVFGSSPRQPTGLEALGFGNGFQLKDAVQLTFQNLVQFGNGFYEVTPQEIDTTIKVTDSRNRTVETVLWTTVHADTAGGMVDSLRHSHWTQPHTAAQPRWRSMTTALSTVGTDLTRNEYLEFWLYQTSDTLIQKTGMRIVVDIGKVSEDAIALAPTAFAVNGQDTTWVGRQAVGLGRLNTERTSIGTWNALSDDNGILGDRPDSIIGPLGEVLTSRSLCSSKQTDAIVAYPLGDLSGRCSRGNGVLDTEDLDGDGVLDALGSDDDVQRYIVDLHDAKYFIRDHKIVLDAAGRTATWTLYRVPLRDPDAIIGQPDLRLAKQMRLTFVTPPGDGGIDPTLRFGLARMRLTGAPWIRRTDRPILGIAGVTAEAHGTVLLGSVSTQNTELGYVSPPGLGNSLNAISSGIGEQAIQINEKSLRIIAKDLRAGERAEAYLRVQGGGQNLLAYRELRIWMRGRGPGWGNAGLEAYLKVGSDINNFYLYHTPSSTTTWEPDVVIDMERWRQLRAEIEARFQRGDAPSGAGLCGGNPQAWVACDGPYLVQVLEPQINPPNLAAVQELSVGIWQPGTGATITETELWVDDIRVREPVTETGVATAFSGRFIASDVATLDLDISRQDGRFRQLGEIPSYRTVSASRITGSLHLDRLVPTFGFDIPLNYSRNLSGYDPQLISGTDIRGAALTGLRRASSTSSSWNISVRRLTGYSTKPLERLLLDPLVFSASGSHLDAVTELSQTAASSYNFNLGYLRSAVRRGRSLGLGGLIGGLPRWFSGSEAGQGLAGATVAPLPTTLRLASALSRSNGDYLSFKAPIERLSDTILRPVSSIQHLWSNSVGVTWQPVGLLTFTADWRSTRDLRHYPDSTSLGRVVGGLRRSFAGQDVGVERDRNVSSVAIISPRINSWLRPQLTSTSNFFLSRSLTSRNPIRLVGDTAGGYVLPQTLNNSRSTRASLDFDPLMFVRRLTGDSSAATRALSRLRPIVYSRTYTVLSTYDLVAFGPAASYQFALGKLDAFLHRQGQQAIGAGEMLSHDVSADFDLPARINLTMRYASTESDRYQGLLSGGFLKTVTKQQTWPSGEVRWSSTVSLGPLIAIQTSARIDRQSSTSQSPLSTGAFSVYSNTTRTFRPTAGFSFRNGMGLDIGSTWDKSVVVSSGNTTRRNGNLIDLSVRGNFRMPVAISKVRRSLNAQLDLQRRSDTSCLEREADSGCSSYSDQLLTNLTGRMDAVLGGANQRVGTQFGWFLDDNRSLRRQVSRINFSVYLILPLTLFGS